MKIIDNSENNLENNSENNFENNLENNLENNSKNNTVMFNENKCEKCNKLLSSKYSLNRHMKICKKVNEPPKNETTIEPPKNKTSDESPNEPSSSGTPNEPSSSGTRNERQNEGTMDPSEALVKVKKHLIQDALLYLMLYSDEQIYLTAEHELIKEFVYQLLIVNGLCDKNIRA